DPEALWTQERFEEAFPPPTSAGKDGENASRGGAQPDEGDIPADTMRVIRDGPRASASSRDRSQTFWNVMLALKRVGFTVDGTVNLHERYPDGIAKKYEGRLRQEVERVYNKLDQGQQHGAQAAGEAPAEPSTTNEDAAYGFAWTLLAHGEEATIPARKWLVEGLLPETGVGLIAGQWGTYKTFAVFDLAAAVMTGGRFIHFPIMRKGGVLLLATEGQSEVDVRLTAAWEHHGGSGRAPFVWVEKSPRLLDGSADKILVAMIRHAEAKLRRDFDLPAVMVLIDALGKAAGYSKSGDENDAALAKIIMGALEQASAATGVLMLGVTHFGKHVDTGTRGSSVFEDDADTVLALVGERAVSGTLTNARLCVRKSRSGSNGDEYPISARGVTVGSETTLVMDWQARATAAKGKTTKADDPWRKKSLRLLRQSLMNVLVDHGKEMKPWADGPTVRAVDIEIVRGQFYHAYPAAEATDENSKRQARRKAFARSINDAKTGNLIGSWEI